MSRSKRYILIAILFVFLACVRGFEDILFYDPFLQYYRIDFTELPLPGFDFGLLIINLGFRYLLNSLISLAIIHLWFQKKDLTKFSSLILVIFFILLIAAFIVSITIFPEHKMMLFYIRRFLIHPIFLILFIPAFFFQEKVVNNKRS